MHLKFNFNFIIFYYFLLLLTIIYIYDIIIIEDTSPAVGNGEYMSEYEKITLILQLIGVITDIVSLLFYIIYNKEISRYEAIMTAY